MGLITIYHNPRCRKSREGLQLLQDKNIDPEIRLYIDDPLTKEELKQLINKLGIQPIDLVRQNEAIWKTEFKGKQLTSDQVLNALVSNPKLIERPVVARGDRAVIGRPTEKILELV